MAGKGTRGQLQVKGSGREAESLRESSGKRVCQGGGGKRRDGMNKGEK